MEQTPNVPFQSSGGPQFGIDEQGGWNKKTRGWFNKYGSSVILPIIALLILAGGIYLYARQKTENNAFLPMENVSLTKEITETKEKKLDIETEKVKEEKTEKTVQSITVQEKTIQEIIPQTEPQTAGSITEKAAKGEGITHLARRALKNYLKDNPKNLTNEHKVFIEDYIKDKTDSRQLAIGEEINFSKNIIEEAVNASAKLNAKQLKNLEKYSTLVNW